MLRIQTVLTYREIQKLAKLSREADNGNILFEVSDIAGPEIKTAVPFEQFKKDPLTKPTVLTEFKPTDALKRILKED